MNQQPQSGAALKPRSIFLRVLLTCGLTAAILAALAWWAYRTPGGAVGSAERTNRFVAFAFATMGLAWLLAPFLLGPEKGSRAFLRHVSGPATIGSEGSKKARDPFSGGWLGLFRWAAVIDSAGVALLIASAVSGEVTWREGLKLYAIVACFAGLQLALLAMLRRRGAPAGASIAAAVLLAAVGCSSLLWGHLPARLFRPTSRGDTAVLAVVRYANPLLAAEDAINPPTRFDWPHHGRMYAQYGIIGESRAWPMPRWPIACLLYAALAAGCLAVASCPRRPGRSRTA